MAAISRCVWAFSGFLAAAAVASPGAAAGMPAGQGTSRTVYVAAVDARGASVTDLAPEDLTIKEGGKTCTVTAAGPATARLHVAVIIDDNGSGLFRASLAQFLNRLLEYGDFTIRSVTGQVQKLVDFTHDVPTLRGALERLGPRPATPDGGQLIEAVSDSAVEAHKVEAARPVIVALTVGGDEQSPLGADVVLDRLRDSRAALYVISVAPSAIRATTGPSRASDLLDAPLNIARVLGDGPRQSGGYHDEIVGVPGLVLGLQKVADELVHQYVVTYELPSGAKPDERISISTRRKGVTLRAPTRVPK